MPLISEASVGDYLALMKPRVMSLVVFTALVGLVLAPVHVHPVIGFTALLCIAVGAGAAGVLNMWYDADIDAMMTRTSGRPIPRGRVTPGEALGFGMTLATGAVVVLGLLVNWLAATMLAFTIFFYVVIYTMWLKRWTPQNIVIGGAAGAFPPMIGWAAATGGIGLRADPAVPHHLLLDAAALLGAVARARRRLRPRPHPDAAGGGAGPAETRRQILIYSLVLVPLGAAPWLLGYADAIYGAVALVGRPGDGGAGMALCAASGKASALTRRRSSCSASRSSICSCCSPSS